MTIQQSCDRQQEEKKWKEEKEEDTNLEIVLRILKYLPIGLVRINQLEWVVERGKGGS